MLSQLKWDRRMLALAEHVADWSKDPSTQVGAVVADNNRVVSVGFNGFPRGCDDDPAVYADRERKYRRVVHAEVNAILFAGRPVVGGTLYTWPFGCCPRCAGVVIQAGILRVVSPPLPAELSARWAAELSESVRLFEEADIEIVEVASC